MSSIPVLNPPYFAFHLLYSLFSIVIFSSLTSIPLPVFHSPFSVRSSQSAIFYFLFSFLCLPFCSMSSILCFLTYFLSSILFCVLILNPVLCLPYSASLSSILSSRSSILLCSPLSLFSFLYFILSLSLLFSSL